MLRCRDGDGDADARGGGAEHGADLAGGDRGEQAGMGVAGLERGGGGGGGASD
ncbi:MAG: hypothetical protein ACRYGC_14550 [Janthinobacterium lividum]